MINPFGFLLFSVKERQQSVKTRADMERKASLALGVGMICATNMGVASSQQYISFLLRLIQQKQQPPQQEQQTSSADNPSNSASSQVDGETQQRAAKGDIKNSLIYSSFRSVTVLVSYFA